MKALLAILFLLVFGISTAHAEPKCQSSERFGTSVIKQGDSERKVIEQNPDRETQVQSKMGGVIGLRYDFYKQGRTIQIYTKNGVVTQICRIRD